MVNYIIIFVHTIHLKIEKHKYNNSFFSALLK